MESGTGVVAHDHNGVVVASRSGDWLAGTDQKRLTGIRDRRSPECVGGIGLAANRTFGKHEKFRT